MYSWVDHTAELELAIEARDRAGVFEDALAAIRELMESGSGGDADRRAGETREIRISAPDQAALLAEWLEELVFLAETDGFIPIRLARIEAGDATLSAIVEGFRGRPRNLVKAVTYHRLTFAPANGGWRARVVLDV